MNYLDYQTYSILYAKYLQRPSEELLEGIEIEHKRVLDACCGSGRMSLACFRKNAKEVIGVDSCNEMRSPEYKRHCQLYPEVIKYKCNDVVSHLMYDLENPVDVIVCQQAINYWFNRVNVSLYVNAIMSPGGYLVFNTFNKQPSEYPFSIIYYLNSRKYTEVSYRINDKVYHVQASNGFAPHITSFDWISPEEFERKLSPYFHLDVVEKGNTSIWKCRKKN